MFYEVTYLHEMCTVHMWFIGYLSSYVEVAHGFQILSAYIYEFTKRMDWINYQGRFTLHEIKVWREILLAVVYFKLESSSNGLGL